jgi:hypothetical protein
MEWLRAYLVLLLANANGIETTMVINRRPYSANIDLIRMAGRGPAGYQVVVSRYGIPLYGHLEIDFEEAMRVANAYIDWELKHHTDT